MNRPLTGTTSSRYRRFTVLLVLTAAGVFGVASPAPAAPTIQWSPSGVSETLAPGGRRTALVSFSSTKDLANVSVSIVPEVAPYVSASPSSFASIGAGTTATVTLTFSAPIDATLGTFDGTLHLRDGGKSRRSYARPLPVTVRIGPNHPPVANAGPDQTSGVLVGDAVILDGSASSDADGHTLTYVWSLTTVPTDSAATLSDPFSERPKYVADKAGTYVTQLVVNDGKADSAPDEVNVTVVIPPPTVTIATPPPETIATANPVTVAGTVDDPLATVTVDGIATPNNNGSYSADVTLAEGGNTITVVATNSTGEGSASVDVTLRTVRGPGPAMTITTPKPDFTAGVVWDGIGASPFNDIPVQVNGTITPNGTPTVMVNGVAATTSALPRGPLLNFFCLLFPNAPACDQRFTFSANILLSKGEHTITAVGEDAAGSTTVEVNGVADYCLKGAAEPGVAAERGNGQNNRCHEIDGCNRNKFGLVGSTDTVSLRNQPMPNAILNRVTVEFGSGYIPPSDERNDFFVHGQNPRDALGCNFHDTCYQTSVPPEARADAFSACNSAQLENHKAMCRKAYPEAECPFTITGPLGNTFKDPVLCPVWAFEKAECFDIADIYFFGVKNFGRSQYDVRQNDYSLP